MSRITTISSLAVVVCAGLAAPPVRAQLAASAAPAAVTPVVTTGDIQGVVTDDDAAPLAGVVVSALGPTSVFAVTDSLGRFGLRTLPPGAYLVRAHLPGYVVAEATTIRVSRAARAQAHLRLNRRSPQVLAAGVGGVAEPTDTTPADEDDDHSEFAWRLRHAPRSVLKDSGFDLDMEDDSDSLLVDSLENVGRAMGASARIASALLTDLPLSGHLNLLTSLEHPEDLFSWRSGAPHGAAYLSLVAPTSTGDWAMRGALTDGDVSSWMLAGSFSRRSESEHQIGAGWSYAMQQYAGGNSSALAAVSDGRRTGGELYVYDEWRISRTVKAAYGGRYSRYGYLDEGFLAPRAQVTVAVGRGFSLGAAAARTVLAPGAEELRPVSGAGIWMPPERTFSPLRGSTGFRAERVRHYEVLAEQQVSGGMAVGFRAFQQRVDDQLVTLFGVALPRSPSTDVGHYFVATAGDVDAIGWSAGVSRAQFGRVRGSVAYSRVNADWDRATADSRQLTALAPSVVRGPREQLHDVTASMDTDVPETATRVLVVYSVKSSAATGVDRPWRSGMRYDVEVRQALPFLGFTRTEWAMLLAVRNRFHEASLEGSMFDELLVVRPPRRIVGGLTVQF